MYGNLREKVILYIGCVAVAWKKIFKSPVYWVIAIFSALVLLSIIILLPSYRLIGIVIFGNVFTLGQKLRILVTSFGAFQTNFTVSSRIFSLILSALVGINMAMFAYYWRARVASRRVQASSMFGVLVGILGVGCSACGSLAISTIFGISTAGVVINFLPFKGIELNLLSIFIIAGSIIYLAKKLQSPDTCKVKSK